MGLFEKQRTIDYFLGDCFIFVWVMLKEVKIFRGIVLSAPGTILGRETVWGEQQKKRSHLFFGKYPVHVFV